MAGERPYISPSLKWPHFWYLSGEDLSSCGGNMIVMSQDMLRLLASSAVWALKTKWFLNRNRVILAPWFLLQIRAYSFTSFQRHKLPETKWNTNTNLWRSFSCLCTWCGSFCSSFCSECYLQNQFLNGQNSSYSLWMWFLKLLVCFLVFHFIWGHFGHGKTCIYMCPQQKSIAFQMLKTY